MAETIVRNSTLKKVKFGTTDMMVTEVCGGTMTWGSFNGDEKEAYDQMDKLIEMGVNFFDTAELYPVAFNYGKTTEMWMGNWLTQRVAEGKLKREDIYIATKCNCMGMGASLEGREGPHSYDEEILTHSCKASLERLKCDYIDLYQLHMPSRDTPIFGAGYFAPDGESRPMPCNDKGTIEDFEKQVMNVKKLLDAGLIKHWGLSNENAYGITMFCMVCDKLGVPRPVSCQNDYSVIDRLYEGDTAEACYRFNVVGLPYGCLAGGTLTGKYVAGSKWEKESNADRPAEKWRHKQCPDFQTRYHFPIPMQATEKYVALAEKYGITPTELAYVFARDRWFHASIIIGTTSIKQVEECVNAFKIEKLPEELIKEINLLHEQYRSPMIFYAKDGKETISNPPWLKA